jgi:ribonuclease HII
VASRAPCPSLERERLAWNAGRLLIGVDEAGRGPLAGPVVAAAVMFPADGPRLRKIRDSKTLNENARDRAAVRIRMAALAVGVGAASVKEIDRFNIRIATIMAMRRAVVRARARAALGDGGTAPTTVLVDGLALPELGIEHEALVDGDARCLTVAAAGIIAKTVRDRLMAALGRRYPGYDWSTNRGYGTETHRRAIDEHGPTPHHRRSFGPVAQMHLGL